MQYKHYSNLKVFKFYIVKVYFRSVYCMMKPVSFKAVLSKQGHERIEIFTNKINGYFWLKSYLIIDDMTYLLIKY